MSNKKNPLSKVKGICRKKIKYKDYRQYFLHYKIFNAICSLCSSQNQTLTFKGLKKQRQLRDHLLLKSLDNSTNSKYCIYFFCFNKTKNYYFKKDKTNFCIRV